MTKATYEWCDGVVIDWGTRKPPDRFSTPSLIRGERWKKGGTGSRRPRVRCAKCGRRLIVKSVDQEPFFGAMLYNEPMWVLPRHKVRVK